MPKHKLVVLVSSTIHSYTWLPHFDLVSVHRLNKDESDRYRNLFITDSAFKVGEVQSCELKDQICIYIHGDMTDWIFETSSVASSGQNLLRPVDNAGIRYNNLAHKCRLSNLINFFAKEGQESVKRH